MSILLRTRLNDLKIPYFKMHIKKKISGTNPDGSNKIEKVCSDLPSDWQNRPYQYAMNWNEKFENPWDKKHPKKCNSMCVVLKDTGLVVVDIDNKQDVEKIISENGKTHQTESCGKKFPHLWRKKSKHDRHEGGNDSNVTFGDLCYLNVFERYDAMIDDAPFPIFERYDDYWKEPEAPSVVSKKVVKDNAKPIERERYLSKRIRDDVGLLLEILPNEDEDWNFWWKIISTVKNIHPKLKELAIRWSKKSKKHNQKDFDKNWEKNVDGLKGLNINTLKHICEWKNREGYIKFVGQKLTMTPEYFCELFMENFAKDNVVYTSDKRLFVFKKGNWYADPEYRILKKKIRVVTQEDLNDSRKDYEENDPANPNLPKVIDTLEKIQKRGLVDDIAIFVLQNLEEKNCSLEEPPVFDVGVEQLFNLHFKNGVLELSEDGIVFRDRIAKDYVTVGNSINMWDFQEECDEELMKEVENDFRKVQPDDEQRAFALQWLAYGLTGSVARTKMKFNIGLRASNGKTTEFLIHSKCFPKLIKNVEREYFSKGYSKRHKTKIDLLQKPIRIAYIEEINTNEMDASELKDAVDGQKQNCEIMYGTNCEGSFQCKWNFLGQREPNIKEDEGILRRGLLQNYNSKFTDKVTEDNWETNEFPLVDNFANKYDDDKYKNAYLWLLLNHYKGHNFSIPKVNEEKFKEHIKDMNKDRELLDIYAEGGANDWKSRKEICDMLKKTAGEVKMFMKEHYPHSKYDRTKMIDGHRGAYDKIKLS